jgi:hypothetical protein
VVDGQLAQLPALEFAGTASADVGKEFQCLFPVTRLALLLFHTHLCDDAITFVSGNIGHVNS